MDTPADAPFLPANLDAKETIPNKVTISVRIDIALFISPVSIAASSSNDSIRTSSEADMANKPIPALAVFLPNRPLSTISEANAPNTTAKESIFSIMESTSTILILSKVSIKRFKVATAEIIVKAEPKDAPFDAAARSANAPITTTRLTIVSTILSVGIEEILIIASASRTIDAA